MSDQTVAPSVAPQTFASLPQRRLGDLLMSLAVARKNFDPSAPDRGRKAVYQALNAVITYVTETIPERPEFAQPLEELLLALRDLDRGTVASLLEPQPIKHRPHLSYSEELFRADAAVLMHFKLKAGTARKVAAEIVARDLNGRGYRDRGDRLAGKQVAAWRNKVSEGTRSKAAGPLRYRDVLRRLESTYPNDPLAAYTAYLDTISGLDFPTIPRKPPS